MESGVGIDYGSRGGLGGGAKGEKLEQLYQDKQ